MSFQLDITSEQSAISLINMICKSDDAFTVIMLEKIFLIAKEKNYVKVISLIIDDQRMKNSF